MNVIHRPSASGVMSFRHLALTLGCFVFSALSLRAQYQGDQILGLTGLKSGSLPGPGFYVSLPIYLQQSGVSLYGPQGNQLAKDIRADIHAFVLPAVQVVTPFKILGANYGASYIQFLINGSLDVASLNVQKSGPYGFGDIYVQPVVLGWHRPHADVTAGYAFFAPAGAGASGKHMWVHEIDFGGTIYPDAAKNWNISTMMYYDFNNKKNNADINVGDILTLSGGIGRSFLKGAANVGVAYGAQWKVTHDSGNDIPADLPINNGRVFAVGPEFSTPVFAKGKNVGLVGFRYEWLVGAKTAFGGKVLTLSFTFARLIPPK